MFRGSKGDEDENCPACLVRGRARPPRPAAVAPPAAASPSPSSPPSPPSASSSEEPPPPMEEPADVTELGRSAWTFLHTLAAYYPELPTAAERERTSRLLRDFAESYPCHVCRDEFVEEVRKSPPPVTSRAELAQWMCRQHNIVNARLEKPQFPCERVDERWRWPSE